MCLVKSFNNISLLYRWNFFKIYLVNVFNIMYNSLNGWNFSKEKYFIKENFWIKKGFVFLEYFGCDR